jgi:multiple sugar transport system substrate-binding protein
MKRTTRFAGVVALATSLLLSACATSANNSGGGASGAPTEEEKTPPKLTNCTNKMKNDAPQVSVWAWYPNMPNVVDNFNENHTDVQICWNNVGAGSDEYTKVQTAISAGKGLADVVMLEADRLSSFSIQNALVDLTPYGADEVKGNFREGAWKDVTQGDKVFAIPVDGGPMGMIYRTDVFKKYQITPPATTWGPTCRPYSWPYSSKKEPSPSATTRPGPRT